MDEFREEDGAEDNANRMNYREIIAAHTAIQKGTATHRRLNRRGPWC